MERSVLDRRKRNSLRGSLGWRRKIRLGPKEKELRRGAHWSGGGKIRLGPKEKEFCKERRSLGWRWKDPSDHGNKNFQRRGANRRKKNSSRRGAHWSGGGKIRFGPWEKEFPDALPRGAAGQGSAPGETLLRAARGCTDGNKELVKSATAQPTPEPDKAEPAAPIKTEPALQRPIKTQPVLLRRLAMSSAPLCAIQNLRHTMATAPTRIFCHCIVADLVRIGISCLTDLLADASEDAQRLACPRQEQGGQACSVAFQHVAQRKKIVIAAVVWRVPQTLTQKGLEKGPEPQNLFFPSNRVRIREFPHPKECLKTVFPKRSRIINQFRRSLRKA